MDKDCRQLNRQVNHLNKRVEFLQSRVIEYRKMMTEMIEINDFLGKVKIFMLRVLQGNFPFDILVQHVGHKLETKELRKLYNGALNLPPHLRRRALTIIYMDFLYISRNTVKRYKRKFKEGGVDKLFDTRKKDIKIEDDPKLKEILISILHSPPKNYNYNRTSWTLKLLGQEMANQGYPICRSNVSIIVNKAG